MHVYRCGDSPGKQEIDTGGWDGWDTSPDKKRDAPKEMSNMAILATRHF